MWFACLLTVVSMANGLSPTTTDGPIVNSSVGCLLIDIIYPDGHLTPADRCIRYKCNNGSWEHVFDWQPCTLSQCSSWGKTTIEMYVGHYIDGPSNLKRKRRNDVFSRTYQCDGCVGTYSFTQKGLNKKSSLGIDTTIKHTAPNQNSITRVLYKEPGITVEFVSPGPNHDAEINVDGGPFPLSHNGSMTPYDSAVGTVYISNHSPSWPRPNGGNIYIVGSQGLAVHIWAYNGYAWFVNTFAMGSLDHDLYGLCDVLRDGGLLPSSYTMQNGSQTTNKDEFIESWKVDGITDNRSSNDESPDENPRCTCGVPNTDCSDGYCGILQEPCPYGELLINCYCGIGSKCCRKGPLPLSSEIIEENIDEPDSAISQVGTCGVGKGVCGNGYCLAPGIPCILPLNNCLCNSTIPENYYCCGSIFN